MCGIITYVGHRPATPILLEGLRRLEYRGYDSAGLAVLDGDLAVVRSAGSIANLEATVRPLSLGGSCGIGHTRWATHGEPTEANAHPHRSCSGDIAVIHNGIIENHGVLRRDLANKGHVFSSTTDTEVLAHLIEQHYAGDLEDAVCRGLAQVRGTFGLAVVHQSMPGTIVLARRGSPLVIGVGRGEHFAASDVTALVRHTKEVIHLQDDEIAVLTADTFAITSLSSGIAIDREVEIVDWEVEAADRRGFEHYMLKEICEQPDTIRNALRGRLIIEDGISKLGGLEQVLQEMRRRRHLIIVSCGTSFYAGMTARYLFEELTEITVEVELASEFRYRKLNLGDGTMVLAISQSGETADTIAAIREAKRKGALCLGLVNVVGSTIARETDAGVYNHAGPEIGVASTKAFTSQLTILALMAVLLGRHQRLSLHEGQRILRELEQLPTKAERILDNLDAIRGLAQDHAACQHFFYLGRKYSYPIALEGALKMKEINYVHAEGFAGGELKHGPIALIDPTYCCVALCPRDDVQDKIASNIQEVRARGARVIMVATEGDEAHRDIADEVIWVPETIDCLRPILNVIPLQLLAYFLAAHTGREVDKPRNLAKSVTVE
ncbi:glutamine--fructose-6-phosphate transaminase (isomerizing) [Planctomycetota bacterium]